MFGTTGVVGSVFETSWVAFVWSLTANKRILNVFNYLSNYKFHKFGLNKKKAPAATNNMNNAKKGKGCGGNLGGSRGGSLGEPS